MANTSPFRINKRKCQSMSSLFVQRGLDQPMPTVSCTTLSVSLSLSLSPSCSRSSHLSFSIPCSCSPSVCICAFLSIPMSEKYACCKTAGNIIFASMQLPPHPKPTLKIDLMSIYRFATWSKYTNKSCQRIRKIIVNIYGKTLSTNRQTQMVTHHEKMIVNIVKNIVNIRQNTW
jgi:hypothetical protein